MPPSLICFTPSELARPRVLFRHCRGEAEWDPDGTYHRNESKWGHGGVQQTSGPAMPCSAGIIDPLRVNTRSGMGREVVYLKICCCRRNAKLVQLALCRCTVLPATPAILGKLVSRLFLFFPNSKELPPTRMSLDTLTLLISPLFLLVSGISTSLSLSLQVLAQWPHTRLINQPRQTRVRPERLRMRPGHEAGPLPWRSRRLRL